MRQKIFPILFLFVVISCKKHDPVKVAIKPFDNFDATTINEITRSLDKIYHVKTYILQSKDIPKDAFINLKSPRYRADLLLKILKGEKADTIDYIVGVTSKDISTSKKDASGEIKKPENKYKDWGIFGLGYRPGPACIISSFRIKNTTRALYLSRIKKIAIHEVGHNLGLKHCTTSGCVMQDAVETIKTIDSAQMALCAKCRKEIGAE
jgi:archaemetzincin